MWQGGEARCPLEGGGGRTAGEFLGLPGDAVPCLAPDDGGESGVSPPAWAWSVLAPDGFPKFHEIFGNSTRSARFSLCEIIFVLEQQLKIHGNG
jgi:hypothetical protein